MTEQIRKIEGIVGFALVFIFLLLAFAGLCGYAMNHKDLLLFIVAGAGFVLTILWGTKNQINDDDMELILALGWLAALVACIVILAIHHF